MINAQNMKIAIIKADTLSSTAAETSDTVDCSGYNYATFIIGGEVATATDASQTLTSLVLKEGDTTSSLANVSGFVGGTDFTILVNNTTTSRWHTRFDVDTRKRKRYLQISMQAAAASSAQTFAAVSLSRAQVAPDSASEYGVGTLVRG